MIGMLKLNLNAVREIIQENISFNSRVEIKDIWLDFGAQIHGDNIVISGEDVLRDYQLLNPRQLKDIKYGVFTIEELESIISKMNERGW
jgi:hypothetical protein